MIEIEYTCADCGVRGAKVEVRERGATEDVRSWMHAVTIAISVNHQVRSPRCRATHITETKIPLPAGNDRVGDPTRH